MSSSPASRSAWYIEDRISALPRDCIACDWTECSRATDLSTKKMRCTQCYMVYYCSRDCQRKHWSQHKADCKVGGMLLQQSGLTNVVPLEATNVVPINEECPICLSSGADIEKPFVLTGCKHQFCFSCIQKWQQQSRVHRSCPMCRSDTLSVCTQDVTEMSIQRVILLGTRAVQMQEKKRGSAEEIQQLRDEALGILDGLFMSDSTGKSSHDLQAMITKAEILLHTKESRAVIEIIDNVINLDNTRHAMRDHLNMLLERVDRAGAMGLVDNEADQELTRLEEELKNGEELGSRLSGNGPARHTSIFMLKATAYEQLEEWGEATEVYFSLLAMPDFYTASSPPEKRAVWMGLAKCFYHLGIYEKSIVATEAALEMNRHFPNVHKYRALSLKAQGDLKGAVDVMNSAALYETPWDNNHREEVLQLYEELKAELDASEEAR